MFSAEAELLAAEVIIQERCISRVKSNFSNTFEMTDSNEIGDLWVAVGVPL